METTIKKKPKPKNNPKHKLEYNPQKYTKLYKPADKKVLINEDDDVLFTIPIDLPDPPPMEEIDGYGLNPKYQKFKVPIYPKRLKALENKNFTITEIWEYLNLHQESYKEEWEFIEREWDRAINGYFFFNNGKVTYIDGWHYTYLTSWKIDVGFPNYRSRDRKFYLAARYAYTTHDAYYKHRIVELKPLSFKGNKRPIKRIVRYLSTQKEAEKFLRDLLIKKPDKEDDYVLQSEGYFVDMGRRTCYGINYPKHRREGATYKAGEIVYCIISRMMNAHGGIQSMDETSAKKAFTKAIVKPWRKTPFFFKPRYDGSTNPKSELVLDVPGVKIGGKGSITKIDVGLESFIDFATSASRQFYDGDKLFVLHNDEVGKTILENVSERWFVQKKCLAQGNGVSIHGLALNTSTVGEMTEKGGAAFFRLCELSHFERRNHVGQTQSGLFNVFIPAYDGLEGFIDIFGESIIEDPEESDLWRIPSPVRDADGKLMGAQRYLESVRNEYLLRDDEESIAEYEEEIRLHPIKFSECFLTAGSGSGLDLKKITQRIKELQFETTLTRRGNFRWENDVRDSRVIWEDDRINGRWVISLFPNKVDTNQRITRKIITIDGREKTVFAPLHPGRFTAGADPYKFRKVEGNRLSKGGGNVFWERDRRVDPDDRPMDEWESYRNICTYSARPLDPDDYAEDMLMMCVYWGAEVFPEINISLVWDHFVRRAYDGYLKYQIDPLGNIKKTPGYNMNTQSGQKIMQATQQYVKNHCHRERHMEILLEWKSIKGIEDITNHDLFAAAGGSLYGSETDYTRFDDGEDQESGSDLSNFM